MLCSKIWRPRATPELKKSKNYLTSTYFLVKRKGLKRLPGVFESFTHLVHPLIENTHAKKRSDPSFTKVKKHSRKKREVFPVLL